MVLQRESVDSLAPPNPCPASVAQETLVADSRAGVSPAQMVERKLLMLLGDGPVPVSLLLTRAPRYLSA
jgi:hypothetical protein